MINGITNMKPKAILTVSMICLCVICLGINLAATSGIVWWCSGIGTIASVSVLLMFADKCVINRISEIIKTLVNI